MAEQRDQSDLIADLQEDLRLLRSSVRDLQEEYAREVRTEQLTVVDEAGVKRVVISAGRSTGSVLVRVDGAEGETTGAELYAADDPAGGAPDVGLMLWKDGEAVRWIRER